MRDTYDVRVFLDPPEDLRRRWKVQRDCSRRGYTTDQVLDELDRREADSEAFIRPQRRYADIVISFMPGDRGDQEHLDAKVAMRPGLVHPELSPVIDGRSDGISLRVARGRSPRCGSRARSRPQRSAAIEEAVWDRMHFASHLRTERLGEFTVGTSCTAQSRWRSRSCWCSTSSSPRARRWRSGRSTRAPSRPGGNSVRRTGAAAISRGSTPRATHEVDELLDRGRDRDRPPIGARTRAGVGGPSVRADLAQPPGLELGLDGGPRQQRNPEAGARGLLDGAVGTQRQRPRLEAVVGEELLVERARARARLAQQPGAVGQLAATSAARPPAAGSSGAVMHTISFSMNGSATSRVVAGRLAGDRDVGGVAEHALEDVLTVPDDEREVDVRMLLGERPHHARDERFRRGGDRRDLEPARRHRRRLARGGPALARAARARRRRTAQTRCPPAVRRMPRPARSNSSQPSSRLSAEIAEDTDGCVTTNSSAAAVTEPPRTTARNAVSWVTVIAISLGVKPIA